MTCNDVSTKIAVGDLDAAAHAHVLACAQCASYAQRNAQVDRSLRDELLLVAPTTLTLQLLALAHRGVGKTHPVGRVLVALTLILVGAVTLLAGRLVGLLLAQLGISDPAGEVLAQISQALNVLTLSPQSLQILYTVRDAAIWLLVTATAWTVADQSGRTLKQTSTA